MRYRGRSPALSRWYAAAVPRGVLAFPLAVALALGLGLLALSIATACTSSAPGVFDAGAASSCKQVTDAGDAGVCFSNADCARIDHCEFEGTDPAGSGVYCCVLGPRGVGDSGAPCLGPDDCASGVCAYASLDGCNLACASACTSSADCPADLPVCTFYDGGRPVQGSVPLDAGAFCALTQ
jgi:hypothetical protein